MEQLDQVPLKGTSKNEVTLNELLKQKQYAFKFFISLFIIGLFNNNGYVMVNTASSNLAQTFNKESLMPMFTLSLILFSSVTRLVNAKYFIKVKHLSRIMIATIFMALGFLIISFACTYNQYEFSFWLSLFAALIFGIVSSLGESTTLGFCKGFPSTVVGYFGSGTGFAGVFGSGSFLILKSLGLSDGAIFFLVTPTVIPYFLSFFWISSIKSKHRYIPTTDALSDSLMETSQSMITTNNNNHHQNFLNEIKNEAKNNKELSLSEMKRIIQKAGYLQINLCLVYFLEYVILICFCDRIIMKLRQQYPERQTDYFYTQGYVIFCFCYQIGVFISRSSLSFYQIHRVQILTMIQGINFIVMLLNTIFLFWKNLYGQFAMMTWVGLMGGSSYVNVMYLILESDKLQRSEKELALTISTVFNDFGILAASITALVLTNYVFY